MNYIGITTIRGFSFSGELDKTDGRMYVVCKPNKLDAKHEENNEEFYISGVFNIKDASFHGVLGLKTTNYSLDIK